MNQTRRIRLLHDRKGVAALEFSVIASFMITLMMGAYELGNAAQQQVALQSAVRAGAAYAATHPTDTTGIITVVTNALPGWTFSAGPSIACGCLNTATGATSTTPCSAPVCTTDAKTVTVSASTAYASLTSLFANAIPSNTASYVVRFQ